jgi:hypothetical protein
MEIVESYKALNGLKNVLVNKLNEHDIDMSADLFYDVTRNAEMFRLTLSVNSSNELRYLINFSDKEYYVSSGSTCLKTINSKDIFEHILAGYQESMMEKNCPERILHSYKKYKRYGCPQVKFSIETISGRKCFSVKIKDTKGTVTAWFNNGNMYRIHIDNNGIPLKNEDAENMFFDILETVIDESLKQKIYPKELVEMLPELEADENKFACVDDNEISVFSEDEKGIEMTFVFTETKVTKVQLRINDLHQENKFDGKDSEKFTECAVDCIRELHASKYDEKTMKNICSKLIVASMSLANS